MMLLVAATIGLVLVFLSALVHYEVLSLAGTALRRHPLAERKRVLAGLTSVLFAHLVSGVLFAAAYWALEVGTPLGTLAGKTEGNALDYIYFSLMSFTTLGVGDIYATGGLRLISSLEGLLGFVLIGWSASFTYVLMRDSWQGRDR